MILAFVFSWNVTIKKQSLFLLSLIQHLVLNLKYILLEIFFYFFLLFAKNNWYSSYPPPPPLLDKNPNLSLLLIPQIGILSKRYIFVQYDSYSPNSIEDIITAKQRLTTSAKKHFWRCTCTYHNRVAGSTVPQITSQTSTNL